MGSVVASRVDGEHRPLLEAPDSAWAHFRFAEPLTVVPGQPYVLELQSTTGSVTPELAKSAD